MVISVALPLKTMVSTKVAADHSALTLTLLQSIRLEVCTQRSTDFLAGEVAATTVANLALSEYTL